MSDPNPDPTITTYDHHHYHRLEPAQTLATYGVVGQTTLRLKVCRGLSGGMDGGAGQVGRLFLLLRTHISTAKRANEHLISLSN